MIVEIIAVGTELLLGQIVNSNAADIGQRLAEDGFDAHFQVTVGDNLDRLVASIETAVARADAVVMTGGIGPTQDDMTRDAICAVLGVGIETDREHAEAIRDRLAARGVVADTALKMADYPSGTTPLANSKGVALGIAASYLDTPIFAVPGVPTEMRAMIDEQVRPRLRAASGSPSALVNRQLHCYGLGESQIAEQLDDLYQTSNPSVAFLINGPEVRVRITAKAPTEAEASAMIGHVEQEVRRRLGDAIFAVDDETVDGIIADLLARKGWTVSAVEALTAGQVGSRLSLLTGFQGARILPRDVGHAAGAEPETAALALLDAEAPPADVQLAVGPAAARQVGIAIRTPGTNAGQTIDLTGDDERSRRFTIPSALHLLRRVLAAD